MTSELQVAKVKETFSLLFVLNNSNLRLVTITIPTLVYLQLPHLKLNQLSSVTEQEMTIQNATSFKGTQKEENNLT